MPGADKIQWIAVLWPLTAAAAWAQGIDHDEARRLKEAGSILPLEQVLDRARAAHPGARVIEAELERERGRYLYELKLVDDEGRVRKLKFDARSGEPIERKRQ